MGAAALMNGFTSDGTVRITLPQAGSWPADNPVMDALARLWHALRLDIDPLADFRERIAARLSLFAAILLLPFVLNHLVQGRFPVAAAIVSAQVVLMVNARAWQLGRPPPIPFWVLSVAIVMSVAAAVTTQGLNGLFWAYPAMFICYFVLPRRQAVPISLMLTLFMPVLAAQTLPIPVAVRVFATLGLTMVMINVVLNVVGDLQGALVEQATTDPLTGAYNRRTLSQQLGQMSTTRDPQSMNALLAIDLDLFKRVNDRHGHAAGDEVLKATVACIGSRIRRGDMLFRTGGEEFVLLLPRTSPADAWRVAEDLRSRVEQAELLPQERITVSIGVAMQRPAQGAEEWVQAADQALYEAKRTGRNRVVAAAATA
jgi:diguanylate cyclase (GGDEF)-like protein